MNWRQVLQRAASVDPEAERLLGPVVSLLEAARHGAARRQDADAVFGDRHRVPFLDALDRAVRARDDSWDRETLEAVRATLFIVRAALFNLYPAQAERANPAAIQRSLDRLEARMATPPEEWASGEVCPRCGARRAEIVSTSAVDPPVHELRCHACGYAEDWVGHRDRG